MFCFNCGQPIPASGKFCPNCGTPMAAVNAPAAPPAAQPQPQPQPQPYAPPPVAYAPPAAPVYAPPPVAPAPPPVAYAAPPPVVYTIPAAAPVPPAAAPAADPTTERLIYYESAVRTKVPGRSFWNYDILITERRLIARKTGWKGNLTKGMARSAAGGLVNALVATALYSLDFGMSQVKTPKYDNAPVVPVGEVDGFRDKADGAVEFRFDDLTRCILRKGGFIAQATLVLQSPQGELLTEANFFKDLKPILRQILGARCSEE